MRGVVTLVVASLLAGCGAQPAANVPSATPSASAATSVPTSGIFFARQAPVEGERVVLEALIEDALVVVENGCVRIEDGSDESALVIWPPGTTLRVEGDDVLLLDEEGRIIAQVGQRVTMGGGYVPYPSAKESFGQTNQFPPDECGGPYWLAGDMEHQLQG